MSAMKLARPEVRALRAYRPARQEPHALRLNANEASWAHDGAAAANRYPPVRPLELQTALASLYNVPVANLLATRGTSEGIDLLVRAFCRPGIDNVVVMPPTFGMYRVYAEIQDAAVISVPLPEEQEFAFDTGRVLGACNGNTRLVFVCSPNNPTGNLVARTDVLDLAEALRDRSLVVVDEAYIEYSGAESLARDAADLPNLVVLRTLSKAFALAGARCGSVIASVEAIDLLGKLLAPYALSTPVIDCAGEALTPANLRKVEAAIRVVTDERERMAAALAAQPLVRQVWPSHANFLLVRFTDAERVRARLCEQRILVRELDDDALAGCARITVGTPEENERLLDALAAAEAAA